MTVFVFSTERKTRHVTTTYLTVSPDVQQCARIHARTLKCTGTHMGPQMSIFTLLLHSDLNNLLIPRPDLTFFSPQEGMKTSQKQQENGDDHSHFLTELTVSLPRSEIGGSEKHTIRNHYSAPN